MSARIIDGTSIAASTRQEIKTGVDQRLARNERAPGLAVILVGSDPASQIYVRAKRKDCQEVGIQSFDFDLPPETGQEELLGLIDQLNNHPEVDGILVQLPLPPQIDSTMVIERIRPDKDVDGFHPYNIGRLALRIPLLRPCTPRGAMTLIESTGLPIQGQDAVVVGASNHVGRPMALELLMAGTTVTTCHSATRDLPAHVARADILVVAAGRPNLVQGEWVKPGAVVIDIGINRGADGRITGDVEFETARDRAGWISPVPGGAGPMTRAMLLKNTLDAAEGLSR